MASYLVIESRDPFTSNEAGQGYALAADLARRGDAVTLFLVQNGVLPARAGAKTPELLGAARAAGVEVLADEFSLRERGIPAHRLTPGVRPAPIDVVVDHLAAGRKTIWH
jgi:hypothetical protein